MVALRCLGTPDAFPGIFVRDDGSAFRICTASTYMSIFRLGINCHNHHYAHITALPGGPPVPRGRFRPSSHSDVLCTGWPSELDAVDDLPSENECCFDEETKRYS